MDIRTRIRLQELWLLLGGVGLGGVLTWMGFMAFWERSPLLCLGLLPTAGLLSAGIITTFSILNDLTRQLEAKEAPVEAELEPLPVPVRTCPPHKWDPDNQMICKVCHQRPQAR